VGIWNSVRTNAQQIRQRLLPDDHFFVFSSIFSSLFVVVVVFIYGSGCERKEGENPALDTAVACVLIALFVFFCCCCCCVIHPNPPFSATFPPSTTASKKKTEHSQTNKTAATDCGRIKKKTS